MTSQYEDANIGVNRNTWNVSQTYPVTFQDCINMMFIDTIWMGALSWYVASIWPSEFGTHKPFYFLCLPSFWMPYFGCYSKRMPRGRTSNERKGFNSGIWGGVRDDELVIEAVTENLVRQVEENTCVNIIDLCKEFKSGKGKKVAVDGLNLTMYSGQITALLGHNGAGKVRN